MSLSRGRGRTDTNGGRGRASPLGGIGAYLLLGWQIALAFVVYGAIGYLLDWWLETSPWLLVVGVVLGLVAVYARLHRMVIELDRQARRNRERRAQGADEKAD